MNYCRKDSFITHRAFCDALAEESARLSAATNSILGPNPNNNTTTTTATQHFHFEPQNRLSPPPLLPFSYHSHFRNPWGPPPHNPNPNSHTQQNQLLVHIKHEDETLHNIPLSSPLLYQDHKIPTMTSSPFGNDNLHVTIGPPPPLSATALLQKAAMMGGTMDHVGSTMAHLDMHAASSAWAAQRSTDGFTRDFLGLTGDQCNGGGDGGDDSGNGNMKELFSFTGGVTKFPAYDHDRNSMLRPRGFEFTETYSDWGNC